MSTIKIIVVAVGVCIIAGVLSFKLGKMSVEKEIIRLKESVSSGQQSNDVSKSDDIKTVVEEVKKLKEKVVAKEQENKNLKEEYESLLKKFESRENTLKELMNEFIKQGIAKGLTPSEVKKDKKYEQMSPEEIISELTKAIEAKDGDKALDLWQRLLELGPSYYAKAIELHEKIEKEILAQKFNFTNDSESSGSINLNQLLNQQMAKVLQYAGKMEGIKWSKSFKEFAEWVLNSKEDIKSNIQQEAIQHLLTANPERVGEVYNYIREKLSQSDSEETAKRYYSILSSYSDDELRKRMYEDLANPAGDLKVKKGIAHALGSQTNLVRDDTKKEIEKAIETAALGNSSYGQQIKEEFEKGKKEIISSMGPPVKMELNFSGLGKGFR